jgi:hypothetical protein
LRWPSIVDQSPPVSRWHCGTNFSEASGVRLDTRSIERIEEALREIAILFVALAPLDVFLGDHPVNAIRNGLIFVAGGLILFVMALHIEKRRLNG